MESSTQNKTCKEKFLKQIKQTNKKLLKQLHKRYSWFISHQKVPSDLMGGCHIFSLSLSEVGLMIYLITYSLHCSPHISFPGYKHVHTHS